LSLIGEETLDNLKEQKEEEDKYFKQKEGGELSQLPLDAQHTAKSFGKAKQILDNWRGNRGIPLSRVIRPTLAVPAAVHNPPYGDPGSR
jgi:hypothetical protein